MASETRVRPEPPLWLHKLVWSFEPDDPKEWHDAQTQTWWDAICEHAAETLSAMQSAEMGR